LKHERSFDHLAKPKPAPGHVSKPQILPNDLLKNGFEFSNSLPTKQTERPHQLPENKTAVE
jgi:hypothetical protein